MMGRRAARQTADVRLYFARGLGFVCLFVILPSFLFFLSVIAGKMFIGKSERDAQTQSMKNNFLIPT